MPATPPIPLTAPPVTPDRSDRANFAIQSQNWTLWQKNHNYPETVLMMANVAANATEAFDRAAAAGQSATAAQNAAIAAETSAQTAAALSGAPMWVAGNYTFGDYVWSPTSLLGYRRKTAGTTASATDPSSDPAGWKLVGSAMSMPQQELAGAGPHQLMVGMHYLVLHPQAVLLMPVGAAAQEQVRVTDMSDGITVTLQREPGGLFNGQAVDTVFDSRGIDRIFTKTVSKGWL